MVRRRIFYLTLAILTVLAATAGIAGPTLFLAPPAAPAFSMVELTTLTVLTGQVEVRRSGQADYQPAASGLTLAPGDTVRTGPSGRALITYFEGSTTVLEPAGELQIQRLEGQPAQAPHLVVRQIAGSTWHKVVRLVAPGLRMEVHTPTAVALVRGTEFLVTLSPRPDGLPATRVAVVHGAVDVTAAGVTVTVQMGEMTDVEPGQPPSAPQPIPPPRRALVLRVFSPAELLVQEAGTQARVGMRNGVYFSEAVTGQADRLTGAWAYLPASGEGAYTLVLTATGDGEVTLRAAVVEDGWPGGPSDDPAIWSGRLIDQRTVTFSVRRSLTYVANLTLDRAGRIARLTVPVPPDQALPPLVVARAALEGARGRSAGSETGSPASAGAPDADVPSFISAALDLLTGDGSDMLTQTPPVPAALPTVSLGSSEPGTLLQNMQPDAPDIGAEAPPPVQSAGDEPETGAGQNSGVGRPADGGLPSADLPELAGQRHSGRAEDSRGAPATLPVNELPAPGSSGTTPVVVGTPQSRDRDGDDHNTGEPSRARPTPTPPTPDPVTASGEARSPGAAPAGRLAVLPAAPAGSAGGSDSSKADSSHAGPVATATPLPMPVSTATPTLRPEPARTPRDEARREAAGMNVAAASAGARVQSVTFQAPGHAAAQLLDGRDESTWSTRGSPNETDSVTIELAVREPVAVGRILLRPGPSVGMPHASARVELQVAGDGAGGFTTVALGVLSDERAPQEFTFQPVQARYVRLVVTRAGSDTWSEIGELEVYPAGVAPALPRVPEPEPAKAREKGGKR